MNSNQWKKYKLEEVAEIIGGGTPSTTNPDFWGEEISWITPRDLASTDERFISRGERCITKKGLQNSSARLLPAGTVLLTTRAPIGYLRIALNPICTNQGFKSLIPKADIADNQFLFYLLKNNIEYLKSVGVGTTFAEISGSALRQIEFPFPPLPTQRRIAAILSALDDKIELNRQTNATLEAIAQAIFKEWFVKFNFPGATGEMQESELGPIPKGWRVGKLGDVCINSRIFIDPQESKNDIPYVGLEHIPRKSLALLTWGFSSEVKSQKTVFKKRDILFGKLRPYFHKVCIAPIDGICSTDILVIEPRKAIFFSFCLNYLFSDELIAFVSVVADGTRMPRVNWKSINNYKIPIPPENLISLFNFLTSPFYEKMIENTQQSKTLMELRNSILPKLMIGELLTNNGS